MKDNNLVEETDQEGKNDNKANKVSLSNTLLYSVAYEAA